MKCKFGTWVWPTWPGLAVPGIWVAYVGYLLVRGHLRSWQATLVALWPALLLYAGSCILAAWGRRGSRPRLASMLAVGLLLAAADLAAKVWIEAQFPYHQPRTLLPGLLAIDPVHNVYGTMLAIPGARPYLTVLAIVLGPAAVLGYRHYLKDEEPVVWGHAAFVGLFAGALAKAGDLLQRGLIVDYLHIPGLPVADLADVYLLWIGGGCALAATLCYPEAWPRPWRALREWLGRVRRR